MSNGFVDGFTALLPARPGDFTSNHHIMRGKAIAIVVPLPGALESRMDALWNSAPCFTMESPNPVPPVSLEWDLSIL